MINYRIFNANKIQERIEEFYKESSKQESINKQYSNILIHKAFLLEELLSNSIPLIPEIEKAFNAGSAYTVGSHEYFIQTHLNKKDYVLQLKLDI